MRIIDADRLMQHIKHKLCISSFDYLLASEKAIVNVIESEPSVEMPTWIPCSERLPSVKDYVSDMVIWCTDKSIVGVGWYYERTKSWGTVDDTFLPVVGEVFAWMPLPEPMKGAEDE